MKKCIKSVKWTGANNSPVKPAEESCKSDDVDCQLCSGKTIHKCLLNAEDGSVEWEISHDSVVVTRMICRTLIWLTLIGLLFYIAMKWFK